MNGLLQTTALLLLVLGVVETLYFGDRGPIGLGVGALVTLLGLVPYVVMAFALGYARSFAAQLWHIGVLVALIAAEFQVYFDLVFLRPSTLSGQMFLLTPIAQSVVAVSLAIVLKRLAPKVSESEATQAQ